MHRPNCRLALAIPALILGAYLLGGCASTKPPTPPADVKETRDTTWAVVPLVVPDTTISGHNRISKHDSLTVGVQEALGDAGQPFRMSENVELYDFYRRVPAKEEEQAFTFELIPAVLDSIRRTSGCRYLLAVQGTSWSKTTGQVVEEIGIAALSGLASGITGVPIYYAPNTPGQGQAVVVDLIDAQADSTIRGGVLRTEANTKLASRSAVVGLLTGRSLTPRSFEVDTSDDVIVYRYEKPDVVGTGFHVDATEAVVERPDGANERLPIHTVKRVKSTTQNRFIFPVEVN